jgi:hypothetical protein
MLSMSLIKKVFTPYFIVFASLFTLTFTVISCKKDTPTPEPACLTCERDKFLGTYTVSKGCTVLGISVGDFSNITAGSANNAIVIDGDINATVSGSGFTIVKQTISGLVLSGSGNLSGKTMTMTVTLTQGTSSSSCSLTFDKQ